MAAPEQKYEHPLRVNVTIPQGNQPKQYGVHSTLHPTAASIKFRCNAEEKKLIDKWRNELQLTESAFTRECVLNTCKELERLHNAYLRSIRSG